MAGGIFSGFLLVPEGSSQTGVTHDPCAADTAVDSAHPQNVPPFSFRMTSGAAADPVFDPASPL
jgi:hypothetical protein